MQDSQDRTAEPEPAALWSELEFRHLEYAIAVAEHRGFILAAIALGLDQGFLSKQIQRLEARLGFPLFNRKTRPLAITEAGHDFLEQAGQILSQTRRAVALARETHQGKRGRLDIGINTSIANSKLPEILQAFHQQFPEVSLVLHELASYDQIAQLQTRQLDIGFFHRHNLQTLDAEVHLGMSTLRVLCEPLVAVLPQRHRLARRATVSLIDLRGDRFILPPHSLLRGLRDEIERVCQQAGFKPRVEQEAAWITTVLSLVTGGVGVSLLPANVKHLQRSGVVYRDLQDDLPDLEIVAVWQTRHPSVVLAQFLAVVQAAADR
ncbi:MAG: LysR family transcriptional regulator [Cyanobacteria bacterium J069]